ncbi:MAG: peptidoglycan-binding domain-containing protein [Rubricoccaceae bacterium]|nr:peptidoglycan-binding domain-containing protein [Rubricoccaceae bacterium]
MQHLEFALIIGFLAIGIFAGMSLVAHAVYSFFTGGLQDDSRRERKASMANVQPGNTSLVLLAGWVFVIACVPESDSNNASSRQPPEEDRAAVAEVEQTREGADLQTHVAVETIPGRTGSMLDAQQGEGLILGLDGERYEAGYLRVTIARTQVALRQRGLYLGPITGVLDPRTMQAVYEFQEASYGLLRCGIPTPRTRRLLEQGSHTF